MVEFRLKDLSKENNDVFSMKSRNVILVKFNCVLYNSIGFYFSKWVAPDKLYQDLTLIEDDLLWGDIYAKIL